MDKIDCPLCKCPTDVWEVRSHIIRYCVDEYCGWNREATPGDEEEFNNRKVDRGQVKVVKLKDK